MKQSLIILATFISASTFAQAKAKDGATAPQIDTNKVITIKMRYIDLYRNIQNLANTATIIDRTNLPHDQVTFILKTIQNWENIIVTQVNGQMADPKVPANDSTGSKKPKHGQN